MSESTSVYERLKALFAADQAGGALRSRRKGRERADADGATAPFAPGRDPRGIGALLDSLTEQLGWNSPLARSELIDSWTEVVGEETAKHSEPVAIDNGVLMVRCDSTSWATQLRLMRASLLEHVTQRYPDAGIETMRFQGPDVPTWKRGPRSIPGRGPRDTYG